MIKSIKIKGGDAKLRQMRQRLRESEKKFVAVFNASPDLMSITRLSDGEILEVNKSYTKLLGYTRTESIGKHTFKDLHIWSNQKDRATFVNRLKRSGKINNFETTIKRKNGTLVTVIDSAGVFNFRGEKCVLSIVHDITGRKNMEKNLKQSEEKYWGIFETARDAIMTLEPPSWKFTSANTATLKMFGVKNEAKFLTYPPWALSPKVQPDGQNSKEKAKKMIELAMKKGRSLFAWTHLRIGGEPFFAEVFLSRVDWGKKPFLQAIVRDVTKSKELQKALTENEILFRSLYEQSPIGIFMVSLDGFTLNANKAGTKLFGYTEKELKKMFFGDMADPKEAKKDTARIKKLIAGKAASFSADRHFIRKDKKNVSIHASISLIRDENHKPLFVLIFAEDITEHFQWMESLKKSEEKYSTLMKRSNDGVVVIQDGIIKYANPAIRHIVDLAPKDVVGKPMIEFVAPPYRKIVSENFQRRMAGKKVVSRYEFAVTDKRGNVVPVETNSSRIIYDGKAADLAILRDISRAKQIDKIKSEFVSVASHQLRGPLTGIKWISQLLMGQKSGKLSVKQIDFLQQIYSSNERMIHLVNDLLDVSHIETGHKFVIEKKSGDIIALIHNVINDQKINNPTKNITIKLEETCPDKLIFKFDRNKIYQVFSNLINNSIKYSRKIAKIIIGVKCFSDKVEFSIKDFGCGIPTHQKDRVFQKFFRGDNIVTVATEGTGLGLYITKGVVETHGGAIWFKSTQDKGSTFYFTLPLKRKSKETSTKFN